MVAIPAVKVAPAHLKTTQPGAVCIAAAWAATLTIMDH